MDHTALVDTHCHLDVYDDPAAAAAAAEAARVITLAVTNLPSHFPAVEKLARGMQYVKPALGLHPQNAFRCHYEMELMWTMLHQTRYIGEIGLDYATPAPADRQVQRFVLGRIVERCAVEGNKILSLHSRRAAADVIAAVGPAFPGKAILHWYSGSSRDLAKAVDHGFYFSVNPSMTRSKKRLEQIAAIPRDRVLTETDGPYIKVGRRAAEPADVALVLPALAGLWGVDTEEAGSIIRHNFEQLSQ
jgi:TatD DNase family protein